MSLLKRKPRVVRPKSDGYYSHSFVKEELRKANSVVRILCVRNMRVAEPDILEEFKTFLRRNPQGLVEILALSPSAPKAIVDGIRETLPSPAQSIEEYRKDVNLCLGHIDRFLDSLGDDAERFHYYEFDGLPLIHLCQFDGTVYQGFQFFRRDDDQSSLARHCIEARSDSTVGRALVAQFDHVKSSATKRIRSRDQSRRDDAHTGGLVEPTPPSPESDKGYSEAVSWLLDNHQVRIGEYSAVGGFVCADSSWRGALKNAADDVRKRAREKDRFKPIPVLLCGPPGCGKSFFVEQVCAELDIDPKKIIGENLSDAVDFPSKLAPHYQAIENSTDNIRVAFLDEVDTQVDGSNAYRHLLQPILGSKVEVEGAPIALRNVVWFFAASGPAFSNTKADNDKARADIGALKDLLKEREKGVDFIRRFSQAGMAIRLPGLNSWQECIFRAIAATRGRVDSISAQLLFYAASKTWQDTGELVGFVDSGVTNAKGRILNLNDAVRGSALEDFIHQYKQEIKMLDSHLINLP